MASAFLLALESCELQDRISKYVKLKKGHDYIALCNLFGAFLAALSSFFLQKVDEQVASLVEYVWVCQSGPVIGVPAACRKSDSKLMGRSEHFL